MESTLQEYLYIAGFFALGALLIVAFVSWVLHYMVALGSPPIQRARRTAGLAYIVATIALTLPAFGSEREIEVLDWLGPILALPAGLVAYWFWRNDFRRDWIDDSGSLPEGVELANDDWRVGLIFVVGVAVILAIKAAVRLALTP
jgi:hypothetical protein